VCRSITTNYIASHPLSPLAATTGLVRGFQVAFYVLLAVMLTGAMLTATLLRGSTVTAGGVVEEPGQGGVSLAGAESSDEEERPAA
jgi:hypothetical protein